jgi:N-acetylmuramoyl-L-alanine amidase
VVADVRSKLTLLGLLPDQVCDEYDDAVDRAVRGFQQLRALTVDGIVGAETYRALEEARWRLGDRVLSFMVSHPLIGDDVSALQQRLLDMGFDCGRRDGIFGARTEAALREFQRNVGLSGDGTCGPRTLEMLARLARTVTGGRPEALRENERLLGGSRTPRGKLVIVDPGHGGQDLGVVAHGMREVDLTYDLATRIEGRLAAAGVEAFLTRGPDGDVDDLDRATFANAAEADLVISVHVDGHRNPECHGIAAFYYGVPDGTYSPSGERLAELVHAELVARTGLLGCRAHPRTWDLLRRTRMPTVRVEVGYLTNPGDAERLAESELRDAVADGVVAAVQRFYAAEQQEPAA